MLRARQGVFSLRANPSAAGSHSQAKKDGSLDAEQHKRERVVDSHCVGVLTGSVCVVVVTGRVRRTGPFFAARPAARAQHSQAAPFPFTSWNWMRAG